MILLMEEIREQENYKTMVEPSHQSTASMQAPTTREATKMKIIRLNNIYQKEVFRFDWCLSCT